MKKNILLFFTDQQRFDTIHALGNDKIHTPNLDKLVNSGVAFTHAYTNCPVCVPARYALHTGKLPHNTGSYENSSTTYRKSFMEVLQENNYQTHGAGKMHFTLTDREGNDSLWGFDSRDKSEEAGAIDDYKKYTEDLGFEHVVEPLGFRSEMYYIPQTSQVSPKAHISTWTVDKSIDFLKNRDTDKPFFLMTSFIKPHPPFETPVPWNKLYRATDMDYAKCKDGNDDVTTYWNKFQNRYKYRDKGTDGNLYRTMKAAYYAAVSYVDYNIGRLLDYMEENNLMENTMILFTSDHGELMGDYDCYGKRSFVDSAARVPMLMVNPDMDSEKGKRCDTPVSLVDVFKTITDYAGIDYSQTDGESLQDIYKNKVEREGVLGQYNQDDGALYMYTTNEYKYIYSAADDKEYFFDFAKDPKETINFADDKAYEQLKNQYKKIIIDEYKKSGVTDNIDGDDFVHYPKREMDKDPDAFLLRQDAKGSVPDFYVELTEKGFKEAKFPKF